MDKQKLFIVDIEQRITTRKQISIMETDKEKAIRKAKNLNGNVIIINIEEKTND